VFTGGIVIVVPKRSSDLSPPRHHLHAGLTARVDLEVGDADTAQALRSGSVPVLATPRLIALCEEASCRALEGHLAPGYTSVATRVQFDHLAPAAVGALVTAEATLERVEGRRLTFTLSAALRTVDHAGLIGAGRLTRVLVDEEAFLTKAGCMTIPGGSPPAAGHPTH
jgi:fluoroacetyl-CoA thioesterase